MVDIEGVKKRIDQINKEMNKIDKLIAKQEEDDIFDDSLYSTMEELEAERNALEMMLKNNQK